MKKTPLAIALLVMTTVTSVHAAEVSYIFHGITHIGGTNSFTGTFVYDNAVSGSTVYYPGTGPLQQGFSTVYTGAVKSLEITLDNGNQVISTGGDIVISNIQQAETGAQLPVGLGLLAWTGGTNGSINGNIMTNMYLAFDPVTPNYSWDALDTYLNGNAEKLLQSSPSLLPPKIDTQLTGTSLPLDLLSTFDSGVFLGTNHGLTNTVNYISSFTLAPVPEPETYAMLLAGLGLMFASANYRKRK